MFTPNACEGTSTLFPVPYFDLGTAHLSQSGQLYIKATIASVGRCYDFGRCSARRKVNQTPPNRILDDGREAAFVEHEENLKSGRIGPLYYPLLFKNCLEELVILERNLEPPKSGRAVYPYTYDQAIVKLNQLGSDIKHGEDLGNDDEGLLTKDSDAGVYSQMAKSIKPFYMKRDPENADLV